MTSRKYWVALFTLAAVVLAAAAINRPAGANLAAQGQSGPGRVVSANIARIVKEMQETKDLEARFNSEGQNVLREEKEMKEQMKKLQDQRDNFRPDSPQFEAAQREYLQAATKYKAFVDLFMAERDFKMKRLTRTLHDKVVAAINEYAGRQGIDMVISDYQPQVPDKDQAQMNMAQLRDYLNQRRVLFASKQADISDAIIALMDAKYRAEGGGGAVGGGGSIPAIPATGGTGQGTAPAGRGNNR